MITIRGNPRYGWLPDLPDRRDFMYAAPLRLLAQLPARKSLRSRCPSVLDQGALGSCTANAIGNAFHFVVHKDKGGTFRPSRLFIYYNERLIEGTVSWDSGAMIRDGIKSLNRQGTCAEATWPYVVERFAQRPPAKAYTEAKAHQALNYARVAQTVTQMKGCLASGYPFVFGFSVYESFETSAVARTGKVPMPEAGEKLLGGHAVLAVGYDDAAQRFAVQNSWGKFWGDGGFFTIPYAYLTDPDLAADLWTVRTVEV